MLNKRAVDLVDGAMPHVDVAEIRTLVRGGILRLAVESASTVTVETSGTTVILRGRVNSEADRKSAEVTAWSAPHVTEVDNQITITSS